MMLRAPTRTRISLALGSAELSAQYAKLPCDGVVLTNPENLARELGVHPRKLLANGEEEKYLDLFSRNIVRVARDFATRPVVYRTLDLDADAPAELEGGTEYEESKRSAMPGLRGCSRYLAEEASFRLDLRAVKRARDMGCVNVDVMLPFVRSSDELARCREIVIEEGLFASAEFELWMMPDAPATELRVEEILPLVSGVVLAPSYIVQLALHTDRDGVRLPDADGLPLPGVLSGMTQMARACAERRVACSLLGYAGALKPRAQAEMLRELIEAGLTGYIVPPESYPRAVEAVSEAEEALGITSARKAVM